MIEQNEFNENKLGFGLMRLPKKALGIDIAQTSKMVDMFMEAGLTYFDTAFVYPGSEEAAKKSLVDRYPREKYTLATKLHAGVIPTEALAKKEFETSLKRTGAGYFDYYLLHALSKENYKKYEKFHLWDFVKEEQAKGLIRHYGFSFHDQPELLDQILTEHPDVDFVQLQINYADWNSVEVRARENYETARRHGVAITVMSPARGGALASPPEAVRAALSDEGAGTPYIQWALRFAASLRGVDCVLTGASSEEELRQNLTLTQNRKCLDAREQAAILRAMEAFSNLPHVPCDMCHRCDGNCPQNIAIPEIFSALNEVLVFGAEESANGLYHRVTAGKGKGKALLCLGCGACLSACPLKIDIPNWLRQAAEIFDQK